MRAFADEVYGIPPENVVGSSLQYEFRQTATGSDLIRKPEMVTFDDKEMKPVNIQRHIGRRPILAVGNSDGDLQMLEYTADGKQPYLNLLIVHDDAEREYAYLSGTDAVMAAAAQSPWTFVSMKNDFKTMFPPASPPAATVGAGSRIRPRRIASSKAARCPSNSGATAGSSASAPSGTTCSVRSGRCCAENVRPAASKSLMTPLRPPDIVRSPAARMPRPAKATPTLRQSKEPAPW